MSTKRQSMTKRQQVRYEAIPESYKLNYRKAVMGLSRASAVKAKCLDCTNWQRNEITLCVAEDCPLWVWRPYQNTK